MDAWRQAPPGRRHGRLVSRTARGPAAVLAVTAAATVALLGWRFSGEEEAGRVDRELADPIDMRTGTIKTIGQGFANLGGPLPIALAMVVLVVLAYWLRGPRGLALVLLGPPLAMATTSVLLKPLVDRTRGGSLAFPSGHTTSVASLAVTVAVLVLGWVVLPRTLRWLAVVALAGLVTAVAVSQVGRGYHYPTDTVGALGVALAVVLVVALLVDGVADLVRRRRRAPPPPVPPPWDAPTEKLPARGARW